MKKLLLMFLLMSSALAYVSCPSIGNSTNVTLDRTVNRTRVWDTLSIYLDSNTTTGETPCRITTTWNDYVIIDYIEPFDACDDNCCSDQNLLNNIFFGRDQLMMHDGKLRYELPIDNKYEVGESYELLLECGSEVCYKIAFLVDPGRVPFALHLYNGIWSITFDPLGWVYVFILITALYVIFKNYLKELGVKLLRRLGLG